MSTGETPALVAGSDPSEPARDVPLTAEPEIGSPAWVLRRKVLWDQKARDLMAALIQYEDEHPNDAICLLHALEAARRTVPRA